MNRIRCFRICTINRHASGAYASRIANVGTQLFTTLACVQCHSINGKGGSAAPDLGRPADRNFSSSTLAAHDVESARAGHVGVDALTRVVRPGGSERARRGRPVCLFLHCPLLRTTCRRGSRQACNFKEKHCADCHRAVWAEQFFQDSGKASASRRVYAQKQCAVCHENAQRGAPRLTSGEGSFSGSSMVAAVWHHGPQMQETTCTKNMVWPRFDGSEMANLIAFRNSGNGKKQ